MAVADTEQRGGASRQAALAQAVSRLRLRRGTLPKDRWLLYVGGVLMPLGALMVFLGWWGASHTPRLFEQIPYMISGGLLGLALVIGGGFAYFAYWQTTIVRDTRAQTARLAASLGAIEQLLASGALAPAENGGTASSGPTSARRRARTASTSFVATANGSLFHRPDCSVVAGRRGLRRVPADEPGLKPCRMCEPLRA